ncbi:CAP domain-containing protein [Salibacterium lacus]|uniref:CAP domain-containing protein n=1 Tax=Salibacterium lacus TaxID=1898109 RepID=A0ABW5T3A0_9BACI
MKGFLGCTAACLLLFISGCQQEEQGGGDNQPLTIVDDEREGGEENSPFDLLPDDEQESETKRQKEQMEEQEEQMENQEKQEREQGNPRSENLKAEVIALTNEERTKRGLDPLQENGTVAEAAQAKSEDMAANDYFAHQSPTYGSPLRMLKEYGADFQTAAENIAAGQTTPEQAVQGWMNSEGHRKNILNEDLTHIGIGYEGDGKYWTQMFIEK